MAKIIVGPSFISKQSHMVICSNEIFKGWLEIIKKQTKKPSAATFRCLAGLDDLEVKQIQAKIQSRQILLSKGVKDADVNDMAERIKQLKQDKIIQDALLTEFNTLNKDKQCPNWLEAIATYNINEVVYSILLQLCDMWIKSKLQVGLKKMEFPIEARQYVEWIINLSKEHTTLPMDVSLYIFTISLRFDTRVII